MVEAPTPWPTMVRVLSMRRDPSDASSDALAIELSDGLDRTYTLRLSNAAVVMLGVMISQYPEVKQALAEMMQTSMFRMDDFVPIIELEIEPKGGSDPVALLSALSAIAENDPHFQFEVDRNGRTLKLAGIDETQIEGKLEALRAAYAGAFDVGPPQIAYREQITQRAEVDYSHKKLDEQRGEFARVKLVLEAVNHEDGVGFMGLRARAVLNEDYIAGVERGVRGALAAGVVEGFPVIGVRALLVDGAFHPTDSSHLAFEIAARAATREAMRQGQPVILEPIMRVEITTPEHHVGAIMQDLKGRRGQTDGRGRRSREGILLTAAVPAANLFGYAASLRSIADGQAHYTVQFERYARVPGPDDPPFRSAIGMRA